jgi:hypothetical protein
MARLGGPTRRRAEVILARRDAALERLVAQTGWRGLPIVTGAAAPTEGDAHGAAALAVGAARIAQGWADECLVLSSAPGRGYAFVLLGP